MPISRNNKNLNPFFAIVVLLLSLSSCYENVEGCLDPDSTNYNLAADIDCDDCCSFPTLSLAIAYSFGEDAYNRVDTVSNDLGQEFVIEDLQTYFSEVSVSDGSQSFNIDETFTYEDSNGNSQEITDDIILATPRGFRNVLGTFRQANEYTSMMFTLGVPTEIDLAQSISVAADHPLAIAGDSLFITDQNQYVKSWILLRQIDVHNEDETDTLQIDLPNHRYLFDDILISQERGSSIDLNIKIDYEIIIAGIDYNTMTRAQVIEQIGDNLTIAITPNL